MSILISSDLHLTDKDKDSYRWDLFPWMIEQVRKYNVDNILLLGDSTDSKDNHSSKLTNRIVDTFTTLAKSVNKLYILRGNHDYIDESTPFFKFLNHINNIRFITEPTAIFINKWPVFLVPNTKDFANITIPCNTDYLFCHQTFKGAKGESGMEMPGIDPSIFDNYNGIVISGDIHTGQSMCNNKIIYCGSPYHVHFGDPYLPRVLLLNDNRTLTNLYFNTIRRYTVNISNPSDLAKCPFKKGDQIKVRLTLENITDWESHKTQITKYCQEHELVLHQIESVRKDVSTVLEAQKLKLKSLTPKEIYENFCRVAELKGDIAKYGQQIIEEEVK